MLDRDPLVEPATRRPRRRFTLTDDTGFDEVPLAYRKYYRLWRGHDDTLAPNEVLCPVCGIVVRSARELRPGDRVYCMACMTRLRVVLGENSVLEGRPEY